MIPPNPGAIDALRHAQRIVVLTGAGVSAESGIPTFRDAADADALWAKYDPMDLATPEAFAADPALLTRWYEWRLCRCVECRPNPGHEALARLESLLQAKGGSFTLLTQNVDGLHREAGSENVHELHGSIRTWKCLGCGAESPMPPLPFNEHPLHCPLCGKGVLRPGVVWFGEMLPERAVTAAQQAVSACDLFMSVGTSALVYPAAGFAHEARMRSATVLEINREPTPLTELADHSLLGTSGELLPALVEAAFNDRRD